MFKTIKGVLAGALLFFASSAPAPAVVVINNDSGGIIDEYVMRYQVIRASGDTLLIDGTCDSACTMFLGIIPRERVCVTRNAVLGFHSGSEVNLRTKKSKFSQKATDQLWLAYPNDVRALLTSKGFSGQEHPELVKVEGKELLSLLQPCK